MMKGALTLKKLRDVAINGTLLFGALDSETRALAHFADKIFYVDEYLLYNYGDMYVRSQPIPTYETYLKAWWILNIDNLNKLYDAMTAEYDPLSNYDMIEHEGEARDRNNIKNGEVHSGSITNNTQPRATENYESTNLDPNASDRKFDSSSWTKGINSEGTISNGNIVDTTTDARTITTTNGFDSEAQAKETGAIVDGDDDSTLSGNDISERLLTRKGNVGVTSSQELLNAELELRVKSFIHYFADCYERDCLTGLWSYGDDDYYRW